MPFKSSLGSLVYAVTMLAILRFATSLSLHRPTISSTPATPHASPQPPSSASTVAAPATRRQWLKAPVLPGLAALIASVVLTPETTLAADPRCVEQSDPFKTIKRCYRVGLDKDGRYTSRFSFAHLRLLRFTTIIGPSEIPLSSMLCFFAIFALYSCTSANSSQKVAAHCSG